MAFRNWVRAKWYGVRLVVRELERELVGRGSRIERYKLYFILIAIPIALVDMAVTELTETEREIAPVYKNEMESLEAIEFCLGELTMIVQMRQEDLYRKSDTPTALKTDEPQPSAGLQQPSDANEVDRYLVYFRSQLQRLLEDQTHHIRSYTPKDQVLTFALGILASLVASVVFNAARNAAARHRAGGVSSA